MKMAPGSIGLGESQPRMAGRSGPQPAPSFRWASFDKSVSQVDLNQSSRIQALRRPGKATCHLPLPPACSQEPPHLLLWQTQPWHLLSCPPSTPYPHPSQQESSQLGQLLPLLITCLPPNPPLPAPGSPPSPVHHAPRPWHLSLLWATLRGEVPGPQEGEVGVQHGQLPSAI